MAIEERGNECEVDLDKINEELNTTQPEKSRDLILSQYRDVLKKRSVAYKEKVSAGVAKFINWAAAGIVVFLVGVCLALLIAKDRGEFYTSFAMDEKTCSIRIGDDWVLLGRRYFSYNYTDFVNMRFVDRDHITERNELFVDSAELIIVGFTNDGKSWVYKHPKGEPGVIPLDYADNYAVFSGSVVGTMTYDGFCKGSPPRHPYLTE